MSTPMEAWPQRHRISAAEYCRMAEIGLLPPDARVELIGGEILEMPPIGKDHESVVDQLKVPLYARHGIPEVWIVDLQHDQLHFFRSLHAGEYRQKSSTSAPGVTPVEALEQVSVYPSRLLAA